MATLPSMSSKRTLYRDRETIQFTPKDWISIGNKINCQLKLFYLQLRFGLFMLIIDCRRVHVGGPGHLHCVDSHAWVAHPFSWVGGDGR